MKEIETEIGLHIKKKILAQIGFEMEARRKN